MYLHALPIEFSSNMIRRSRISFKVSVVILVKRCLCWIVGGQLLGLHNL
jgi:hypothetical protein